MEQFATNTEGFNQQLNFQTQIEGTLPIQSKLGT